MKSKIVIKILLLLIVVVFFGCKKQTSDNNGDNENGSNSEVMVTTYDPQNVTETTAVCGGDVIVLQQGLSLSKLGVCWSADENPTIDDCHLFTGNWNEPFVCTLQGLQANTTYHVRAYALRGLIVYYGEDKMFTTLASPVVNTIEVNTITQTSAVGIGDVISEGTTNVTERGFCWSTHGTPTINDDYINSGFGVGRFSAEITGLLLGTTYHIRAYAISEVGISYGSEIEFTTISDSPNIFALEEEDYIRDGDTLELGIEYHFGFFASSNVVTLSGLSSLTVWLDDFTWNTVNLSGVTSYRFSENMQFSYDGGALIKECTITAVVMDESGNSDTVSIVVYINQAGIPLTVSDFEWHKYDNQVEGIEEFGLFWGNDIEGNANIKPLEGASLFAFNSSLWYEISNSTKKWELFSESIAIESYRMISVNQSSNYDELIGTITPNGIYYLIHITNCTVSSGDVLIIGESK